MLWLLAYLVTECEYFCVMHFIRRFVFVSQWTFAKETEDYNNKSVLINLSLLWQKIRHMNNLCMYNLTYIVIGSKVYCEFYELANKLLFKNYLKNLLNNNKRSNEGSFLFQRLSITVQRFNSVCFKGSFTSPPDTEG